MNLREFILKVFLKKKIPKKEIKSKIDSSSLEKELKETQKALSNERGKRIKAEKTIDELTNEKDEEKQQKIAKILSNQKNEFLKGESKKPASDRVVEMLIKKLNGDKFETELPIPKADTVPIAPPIKDLSKANIAIVNTGGIVPVDNPDRIQSASATRWGKYDISKMDRLKGGEFKTIHAGFDPAAADANPNVIVPLDALRSYVNEGKIGKVHEYFYSTVGTGTTQAEAARMGKEIVEHLKEANVDGVIMVTT